MIPAAALGDCIMDAARHYRVPPPALIGIMTVERGHQQRQNGPYRNGTYDLGAMQVNSVWVPKLAKIWKVNEKTAWIWLRDDACTNVHVAAWILHQRINEAKGSVYLGIAHYHSRTPGHGLPYAAKVIEVMRKKGMIKEDRLFAEGGHYVER